MKGIGIYTITNLINGKIYVGSTTVSFTRRRSQHYNQLRKNKHCNKHLQLSFNKYGEDNFKFEILEEVSKEYCLSTEQYWITTLNVANDKFGYNTCPLVGVTTGVRVSEKNKLATSIRHTGKIVSKETRERMSKAMLDYVKNNPNGVLERRVKGAKACNKKVIKFDLNDNFIKEYDSLTSACKDNNIRNTTYISACLSGLQKTTCGFKWKLKI